MKLYHYTSLYHLPLIKAAGYLKLVESNIGSPDKRFPPYGEHVGPDVVWLTESPSPKGHGLGGASVDKRAVRIEVDIEDAIRWREFANKHGINRDWYRIMDMSGEYTARYWWVSLRPIPIAEANITLL
jgi:hypothetical protein